MLPMLVPLPSKMVRLAHSIPHQALSLLPKKTADGKLVTVIITRNHTNPLYIASKESEKLKRLAWSFTNKPKLGAQFP